MSLVIFTCIVGLLIAPIQVDFFTAMFSLIAVAIGAGAAGTLNMWYESDIDALMQRTCLRPIPTGKVSRNQALIFGVLTSFVSVIMLYAFSNFLSALMLSITILFYVIIYTIWLKQRTPQNIVIGGAAGAFPPIIGWTIATNSITFEPIFLFLIIFFWTPSHFWALSLYKARDYKKAKIPMLPVSDGVEKTKVYIFIYSLTMIPAILFPYFINFAGITYLIPSVLLTLYYCYICYELMNFKKNKFESKQAKKVFTYSIFYLFLIFVFFLLDSLI